MLRIFKIYNPNSNIILIHTKEDWKLFKLL